MSDTPPRNAASRIIRERAMAVLRETRAKIDPHILIALKERISSVMPQEAAKAGAEKSRADSDMPLSQRGKSAAHSEVPNEKAFVPPAFPEQKMDMPAVPEGMEPVDKQKIAQIVLQYMKNREEKSKH